jgi:hypothetical protein
MRGTCDCFAYHAKKKRAFEALSMLVEQTIHSTDNTLPMRGKPCKTR